MVNKLKIAIVLGTRPEIIRLSSIIKTFDKHTNLLLIHTGQNYDLELNKIFFDDFEIREPDYSLKCAKNSKSASETIGNIIIETDKIFEKEKPDALVILGDTNSCLSAISAKRKKIPIFHLEAGNRCFDQRVPEEINRKIVDHISDINLTYSNIAREYLISEGLPSDQIIKIGSPLLEVFTQNKKKIKNSKILKKLKLKIGKYFLISFHREENIENDKNFENFLNILNVLAENHNIPIIMSTHPRTKKRIEKKSMKFNNLISFLPPMSYTDYINLQVNSKTVLSDSGSISEESSILNFRALNIRENHERPESMEESAVMMVGLNLERVLQGIDLLNSQSTGLKRNISIVSEYDILNLSHKLLRLVYSYVDYINQKVWKQ